jgi:DNA polymerase III delta prime subunit
MFGNETIENSLWVERYRPDTLDGYVGNEFVVDKVKMYLENGDVPHLLLYGSAGTGKTTLAKIIAKNIECDLMYINASDENNVEAVRTKIKNFASTIGFRKWKVVILDESDFLTASAQAALRNLMETFSKTTRFILTCNYVEKIIDPIQSRCQVFAITPPSKADVAKRTAKILSDEGVTFDMKDLATIVNSNYPDIRRILNTCQRQVIGGTLKLDKESLVQANYMLRVLEILNSNQSKKDSFTALRQLLADSKVKDFTALYTYLYDNLDNFATGHIAAVILILAESQSTDSFVVDKELHTSAMFIKILDEIKR